MKEATQLALDSHCAYGPILRSAIGTNKDHTIQPVLLVNLLSYMQALVSQGGSYTQLLMNTYRKHPCTRERPWRLILYGDEIATGNVLAGRQERKAWTVYGAFIEYGSLVLQNEAAWRTLALKRSGNVNILSAGISQMVALVLKNIMCRDDCDVPVAGFVLKYPDGTHVRIYIKFGMCLQDGAAHKLVLGLKGDSASKYCMLCKNEFRLHGSRDEREDSDEDVCFTVLKHCDMQLATDAEILQSVDRLATRRTTCSLADFRLWERAAGFNYVPHGLLWDAQIREANIMQPASQYCHDWMHGTCSNGTMIKCIYALLTSLHRANCNAWVLLRSFCALWVLPAHCNMKHLADLFSDKHVTSYKKRINDSVALLQKLLRCTPSLRILFTEFLCSQILPCHNARLSLQCVAWSICCNVSRWGKSIQVIS